MSKLKHIKELKKQLQKLKINNNDVCIVGSAVLAYYNIRENKDIDIIIHEKHRKTDNNYNISNNVECVKKGWLYHINKTTDEDIIFNSNFHFIHNGLKFCNLSLVKKRKSISSKEKDIKDIKLIDDRS
jgi:hypothetical protein